MRAFFLALAFLCVGSVAQAANHYVRQGANGSGTGADWTNASTSMPGTLVRGDTYYVADGTYSGYGFNMPAGTAMITMKKATLEDHGTDTGWLSTYGDGQAAFGPLSISSNGALTIDGRSSSVKYGFMVTYGAGQNGFSYDTDVNNVTIQYVDFGGPHAALTNCAIGVWASGDFEAKSNLTIRHNAIHGSDTLVQLHTISNVTIEYNDLFDEISSGTCHGNVIFTQRVTNGIFRYNTIHNWEVEGFFITFPGSTFSSSSNQTWDIYGNVFYDPVLNNSTRAVETHQDGSGWGPIKIYNNTFVGFDFAVLNMAGSQNANNVADNNLFYNNTSSVGVNDVNHDYNWFYLSGTASETHGQTGTSNPFVNLGAKDFHLARATNAGLSLPSPYDQDPDGTSRGADGVWDRGAYTFGGGGGTPAPPPAAPSNTHIVP